MLTEALGLVFICGGAATALQVSFLIAANRFPEFRQLLLPVVISSTIFFELVGPVMPRPALLRSRPVS